MYPEIYTSDSISPAETEGSISGKSSRNLISDEESMYLHIEQVCSEEEDSRYERGISCTSVNINFAILPY